MTFDRCFGGALDWLEEHPVERWGVLGIVAGWMGVGIVILVDWIA